MISIFQNVFSKEPSGQCDITDFLNNVKVGKWQDEVIEYRRTMSKDVKKMLKSVTISGLFTGSSDKNITQHSGYICIDIDDIDNLQETKAALSKDQYIKSLFTSVSGNGLALIFKIDPSKHYDSFDAISKYIYETYDLIVDPSGRNLSRKRFITFDPDIIIYDDCKKWTKSIKAEKRISKVVYTKTDFDEIVKRIQDKAIDITGDYNQWLSICFGICDQFGEAGRDVFHSISQYSEKYNYRKTDRQFDYCLKGNGSGRRATIGTVYYYAKQAGISTVSERTIQISTQAAVYKKSGLSKESAISNAAKFNQEIDNDIYDQVFDTDVEIETNDNIIEGLQTWLNSNYEIKFNEITRRVEIKGKDITDYLSNSIYIKAKMIFEKLNYDLFSRILLSDNTKAYNPIQEFFLNNFTTKEGLIDQLADCIISDTGDLVYRRFFFKKWVVGIAAAAFYDHSPLMLVLSGLQHGTGKTEFFRRLLPIELSRFYAENKLDAEKDGEILMTNKLLIMDDELGGKNKKESNRMKELSSKDTFSIRSPYGRYSEDLKRLAVLCGTSNNEDVIQDNTGNRRIIAFNVLGVDQTKFNSIDKKALMIEAYNLYKSGFSFKILGDEMAYLNSAAKNFETVDPATELMQGANYSPIIKDGYFKSMMTCTDLKSELEIMKRQILTTKSLGVALKKLGYQQKMISENGISKRVYIIYKRTNNVEDN